MAEVSGARVLGKSMLGQMDSVKVALGGSRMTEGCATTQQR